MSRRIRRSAFWFGAVAIAVLQISSHAAFADDVQASLFRPRFTLLELQYPQAVAVSLGSWIGLVNGNRDVLGVVGDLELGLSGMTAAFGLGRSSSDHESYERAWSFGAQATIHRSWPWWTPCLPTSTTFVGGEVFGAYFAFRCSVGVMRSLEAPSASTFAVGGCGVGLP
jgi:hypothetical protein